MTQRSADPDLPARGAVRRRLLRGAAASAAAAALLPASVRRVLAQGQPQ